MKKYNFILETGDKNVGTVYLPDGQGGNHGLGNVAVDAAKAVIGWLEENLL